MNLSSWLVSTVYVADVSGKTAKGDPTFGAAVAVPARVEAVRRFTRNAQGQKSISSHTIYTTTAIALTSRVWLPGDSAATTQLACVPLSVEGCPDKYGNVTLYKVLLG